MVTSGPSTTPIKDYIESTLTQIKTALPEDARIDGVITLEMSTIVQSGKGGGLDIRVLNLGAEVSESQTQRIIIPIRILTDTGRAVEAALKAKAEKEISESEYGKTLAETKTKDLKSPGFHIVSGVRRADADGTELPHL